MITGKTLEASADLINNKLKFRCGSGRNKEIQVDYIPPLGDGEGYLPPELLLISLASCSGSTVVSLLRRMKADITALKVNAKGFERETHPKSFEKIHLEFVITSGNAKNSDVERAIQLSEETYCPVWAVLKNSVEITAEYKLLTPNGT